MVSWQSFGKISSSTSSSNISLTTAHHSSTRCSPQAIYLCSLSTGRRLRRRASSTAVILELVRSSSVLYRVLVSISIHRSHTGLYRCSESRVITVPPPDIRHRPYNYFVLAIRRYVYAASVASILSIILADYSHTGFDGVQFM